MKRWWCGLAVAVITALPVLLLSPFPTQDGPSHLYAGHLLAHLGEADYPIVNQAFELSRSALSTWTVHGLISILLSGVSPLWAEKAVVLVAIGGLFLVFVLAAGDEGTPCFPLCALPLFAMSFVLRMGFYSFCLSEPLALGAVALWVDDGADGSPRRRVGAGCLVAALPFFHLLTAGWALALMGASSMAAAVAERRAPLRDLGMLTLAALPFVGVAAAYPDSSVAYTWEPVSARVAALMAGGAFIGAGPHALWWSAVPSAGLLALAVVFLRDEGARAWQTGGAALRRVVVALVALSLALIMPEEGAGGAYIGVRCNLLFFLLLLLLFSTWRFPRRLDALLSLAFLVCSAVHLSSTYATLAPLSAAAREISGSTGRLSDHGNALVVVAGPWMDADGPTLATQIRPLLHAGDLLGVGADRTILSFYEGELRYFPVNFKPEGSPFGVLFDRRLFGWGGPHVRWEGVPAWRGGVDYVAVWDEAYLLATPSDGAAFRNAVCGFYEEVYRSNTAPWVIYRLRRGERGGAAGTPRICASS